MADSDAVTKLKVQKERLEKMREHRTVIAGKVGARRQQYLDACAEAEQLFETSDVDKLRQKFSDTNAENDAAVAAITAELDSVDSIYREIDAALEA